MALFRTRARRARKSVEPPTIIEDLRIWVYVLLWERSTAAGAGVAPRAQLRGALWEVSERTIGFFDDDIGLFIREMRSNGHAQDGVGEAFGEREAAVRPFAVGIRAGEM